MRKPLFRVGAIGVALALAVATGPLHAQFVVYDPQNYLQAVTQYEQLIRQYEFMIQQARRLPVDLAARYHAHSIDWTAHDLTAGLRYVQPLLAALNAGDVTGAAYRRLIDPLDTPSDEALGRMPAEMRRRLATAYSTIELADSISRLAIDQTGAARVDGPFTLQAIKNVEHDVVNPADAFHTQTALLEKIGAALAIELRLGAQTNQFQVSALEQLIVDNKRKRDAEATLMNATIRQWQYGKAYGEDLFSHTAVNIDTWRPY
jgi:hypothetical protein